MKVSYLIVLFLITACATPSVDVIKPTRPEHAPKDYKPKGVVKYYHEGYESIVASRKEDAFKRMSDNCKGKYKVLEEGSKEEGGIVTYGVFIPSQAWYISYECLE